MQCVRSSLVTQMVKNPPIMQENWVCSLAWEDPLEEVMTTRSSTLAWKIPMDRGAWQAIVHGGRRIRHHWATNHSTGLMLSCVWHFAIPWTIACHASRFPGKNTAVGYHFLLQGTLPNPGIKPVSLVSPALAGGFFYHYATWGSLKYV